MMSRHRAKVSSSTTAVVSTGLCTLAVVGTSSPNAAHVSSASAAICRPSRTQASAASTPSPPALLSTATDRPLGSGCQLNAITTSVSSGTLSTAITPAWRNNASLVTDGVAVEAVCEAAARCPASLVAERMASTGLRRRDPPCQPGELAGVAEGLQVQHHDPGLLVVFPPHQQVVAADVELVPGGDEVRQAEAESAQLLLHADGDAAGLRDQADVARERAAGREGGVHPHGRRAGRDTETVRADEAHAMCANGFQQFLGIDARRDDDQCPHTPGTALLGDRGHGLRRHAQHRELGCLRQLAHRGVAVDAGH